MSASDTAHPEGEREKAIERDCWLAVGEWIAFSASVIKSGEPWTPACEDRYQKARQGLEGLSIQPWKCAARTTNHGPHDPPECNWPLCGCDPKANKVIEALEEIGGPLSVARPQGEEGLWRPISVEALDGQCVEMRMLSTWKARWTLDEEGHGFFDRIGDAPRAQTEWRPMPHASDCAVHNMPAMPNGPCDCGAEPPALSNQGKPSS